jgi:hypothetical protein
MTGIADEGKAVEWVTCTRANVLSVQDLADHRDKSTALYRGQKVIGYREAMGGDNRWHVRAVLEGRERVFLVEAK